jgi:Recombinase zinc beta ribbon domain/Recombinase
MVAAGLRRDGIATRGRTRDGALKSRGWKENDIRSLPKQPAYIGKLFLRLSGTRCVDHTLAELQRIPGVKVLDVPSLVSREVWDLCQHRLVENRHRKSKSRGWLLQGLITCGECGHRYKMQQQNNGTSRYYRCRGHERRYHHDGSPLCTTPAFRAGDLHEAVWNLIVSVLNSPTFITNVLDKREAELTAKIKEKELLSRPIDDKLADLADQAARLARENIAKRLSNEEVDKLLADIDRHTEALNKEKRNLDPARIDEVMAARVQLRLLRELHQPSGDIVDGEPVYYSPFIAAADLEEPEAQSVFPTPTTRRGLFDWLQLRLTVFHDHIAIDSILPIPDLNVADISPIILRKGDKGGWSLYQNQNEGCGFKLSRCNHLQHPVFTG